MEDKKHKIKQLEEAISAQEQLRGRMADSLIDFTISVLRKELEETLLESQELEQQRKMVTVLFMDVVNSTEMIQSMDPEESMEILDVSLQALAEPVQKNGGNVTRFMGDGFLAVFGLPTALENDTEMAVHSALDILKESENISKSLERKWGIKSFQVRIGINTGLIASGGVTEADHTIMGSTINLAARLEKAAEPGTVLISKHTYQHIRGIFDLEARLPVEAKGFPEPVETYKVLMRKPRTFRLMNRGVEGVETRMIGREQEMRRIQSLARKVIEDKAFRFVTIVGEAGMGKSRLLDEFGSWLELQPTQIKFYKSRASLEAQKQPYALMREIFAYHFEILDDDPAHVVQKKFSKGFRQSIQYDDQVDLKANVVGHLLGYDIEDDATRKIFENPQVARDRAFQHVEMYFRAVAGHFPIMIFLDDIHWADKSSIELLDHLRETLVDIPIMILALSRPSLFERKEQWGKGMGCETIELQPLSMEQSEHLVLEVLKKVEDIPETFRKNIAVHADGNPFYVEELIRMLVEDGVILKQTSAWRIQLDRLSGLQIPPTLTGIIQARFDGLPKIEYTVLQQASVIGKVFWDTALISVNQDHAMTQASIESLRNRDMIFQHESSSFTDANEYSFSHGILRDVVYETVLLKQRRSYHNLTADWLIGHRGERVAEMSSVIANHLVKAERSEEAVDYFLQAANSASRKYANEAAIDLYEQALALIPEHLMDRQFTILLSLESLLFVIGIRDEQAVILERLAQIADQLRDQQKKADVMLRKAWYLFYTSDFPEMLKTAQEAVTVAEPLKLPKVTQEAFYALAWAQMQTDDLEHAKSSALRSLDLARKTGYTLGEGNVHNVLGLIDLSQGCYADARNHIEEFLRLIQESGNQTRQLVALNSMIVILVMLGDYEKAREYGTQQLELAIELGNRTTESSSYVNIAWAASAQGDWEVADEYASRGIAIKRETHHLEALGEGLVWLGYAKLGLGKLDESEKAFRESLEIRHGLGQDALEVETLAGLGRVMLIQGNLDAARKYGENIHAYISRDEDLSGTWEPLKIYWVCYQILQAVGDSHKNDFLKEAVDNLNKRAEKITDKAAKKQYLTRVPWHREILAEWERTR